jgi:hypothetical protein
MLHPGAIADRSTTDGLHPMTRAIECRCPFFEVNRSDPGKITWMVWTVGRTIKWKQRTSPSGADRTRATQHAVPDTMATDV